MPTVCDGDSLQDAYDALPDAGGIVDFPPEGRYDVADGLVLGRTKRPLPVR